MAHAAGFDEPTAASVFGAALAFITPRTLEPESIPQLTLWGLHGLTAIDPALIPELRETDIRLLQSGKPIFTAPLPDATSAEGWGGVVRRHVERRLCQFRGRAPGGHAGRHPVVLRRDVQPSGPVFPLRPARRRRYRAGPPVRPGRVGHDAGAGGRRRGGHCRDPGQPSGRRRPAPRQPRPVRGRPPGPWSRRRYRSPDRGAGGHHSPPGLAQPRPGAPGSDPARAGAAADCHGRAAGRRRADPGQRLQRGHR